MKIKNISRDDLRDKLVLFFETANKAQEQPTTVGLQTKSIINKRTFYKNFRIDVSFGIGRRARIPWIVFLKHEFKASKGVYPYIGADLDRGMIIAHIGFSQQNRIYLDNNIESKINKFNKFNAVEIPVDDFDQIPSNTLHELMDFVEEMLNFFNNISFNNIRQLEFSTFLVPSKLQIEDRRKGTNNIYIVNNSDEEYRYKCDLIINYEDKFVEIPNAINFLVFKNNKLLEPVDYWYGSTINVHEDFIDLEDTEGNFISQVQSDTVYRIIAKNFELEVSKYILEQIHDAGVCKDRFRFKDVLAFVNNEWFDKILIRSYEAYYAYKKGTLFLTNREQDVQSSASKNFSINFQLEHFENEHDIDFIFQDNEVYKGNINLLIGKNGLGKSQTLIQLVNYLSTDDIQTLVDQGKISTLPVFNKLLILSNVYDDQYVSRKVEIGRNNFNYIDYRYINLLTNKSFSVHEGVSKINLTDALKDILRYQTIGYQKINKRNILLDSLDQVIVYDEILVTNNNNEFMPIPWDANDDELLEFIGNINTKKELRFLKDSKRIFLSSGQTTFIKYIFFVLANIEQDSLILIDEPENFLHPNLEMDLIKVLYIMLEQTQSNSIIATHSSYIAREISKDFINVYDQYENVINISKPNIETYGSNLEKISNYVFSDLDKRKRFFYEHLKSLLNADTTFKDVVERYGDKLTSETLSYIRKQISEKN